MQVLIPNVFVTVLYIRSSCALICQTCAEFQGYCGEQICKALAEEDLIF